MSVSAQTARDARVAPRSARPVWWLVLKQEMVELWVGGRVLNLLVLFGVLMSITTYLLATNNEIGLIPPDQTVVVGLTAAITFGLFIGLVIAAESITGERERGTLEPLLLTPASHRHVVLGKFLAALSVWPAAFVLAVPYVATLSRGEAVLWPALFWGGLVGTVLSITFVGLGMVVSIWSESTRVSLFVCLLVYAVSLVPSQLPSQLQESAAGTWIAVLDPVAAAGRLLTRTVQQGSPIGQVWPFIGAPVAVTVVVVGLLFWVAAPRLGLEAGRVRGRPRPVGLVAPVGSSKATP